MNTTVRVMVMDYLSLSCSLPHIDSINPPIYYNELIKTILGKGEVYFGWLDEGGFPVWGFWNGCGGDNSILSIQISWERSQKGTKFITLLQG